MPFFRRPAGAPDVQFLCSGPTDLVKNYTADKFSYTPALHPPTPGPGHKKSPALGGAWMLLREYTGYGQGSRLSCRE